MERIRPRIAKVSHFLSSLYNFTLVNEAAPYPAWSNEPSTSAAYEKTYTEEQTRKLFDQIWSNDLIMSQIIGNVNSLVVGSFTVFNTILVTGSRES